MKEVSEWLTDELKNTVDENIDMVNIRDTAVYGIYDEEKDKYKNVVWTKDNVGEIIKAGRTGEIFIKTDDINRYINESRNENKYTDSLYGYDMNSKFRDYMAKLDAVFVEKYHDDNIHIVLHQNELPGCKSYYGFYGIDLNEFDKYAGEFVNINLEDNYDY